MIWSCRFRPGTTPATAWRSSSSRHCKRPRSTVVHYVGLVGKVDADEELVDGDGQWVRGRRPLPVVIRRLSRCHSAVPGKLVSQIPSDLPAEQGLLTWVSTGPEAPCLGATGALHLARCGPGRPCTPRSPPPRREGGLFHRPLIRDLVQLKRPNEASVPSAMVCRRPLPRRYASVLLRSLARSSNGWCMLGPNTFVSGWVAATGF